MLARLWSATIFGVDASLVQVEVDVSFGLPTFSLVGLPDSCVRESRDRVRSAIRNSGFEFPAHRITINLAPADVRKRGTSFDLPIAIRVVLGPQREAFSSEAVALFLAGVYRVSNDADRMGYRLEGPPIPHVDGADVVSDGNPLGAVQVPGDGQPRVLMADRGTTGGYAKIATVIGPDVGVLAQAIPGDTVGFSAITVEEAHQILREQEQVLAAIASGGPLVGAAPMRPSVAVDGSTYEVVADDGEVLTPTEPSRNGMSTSKYQARATVDGETFDFEVDVSR